MLESGWESGGYPGSNRPHRPCAAWRRMRCEGSTIVRFGAADVSRNVPTGPSHMRAGASLRPAGPSSPQGPAPVARATPARGVPAGAGIVVRRLRMLLTLMRFVCYLITGWMCAHVPRLRIVVADYERCRA